MLAAGLVVVTATVAFIATRRGEGPRRHVRLPVVSTTTTPDLSGVALGAVRGTTTTSLPKGPGPYVLTGRVLDPNGQPVAGATVRATWYRTDPPTDVNVTSGPDGGYRIEGIWGGRWRARAFRVPDLATAKAEELFLGADTQVQLDLRVQPVPAGYEITFDLQPSPPVVAQDAQLVVSFLQRTVDLEGRSTPAPIAGLDVTLVASPNWQRVSGDLTQVTGTDGTVRWILRCLAAGAQSLSVRTNVRTDAVTVPDCVEPGGSGTTTTVPGQTATTARPTTTSRATTTSAPTTTSR